MIGQIYFYVCALIAVAGAVFTVSARNPIRGAMGLLMMIVSIAGLFLALEAQFLAVIQLIVYAGAIVVLFLFVIMLLGPSALAPRDKRGLVGRVIGGTLFGVSAVTAMGLLLLRSHAHAFHKTDADFGSIDAFGRTLFASGAAGGLVPFELSSALLLVAVIGAVAVARGKQGEAAHTLPSGQPGLAEPSSPERFAEVGGSRSASPASPALSRGPAR
jgi:NADH-quinone oxidoreductase subunit J